MRSLALLAVVLASHPAWAGALGEVVGGLRRAADDDDDDKGKNGGGSSSGSSSASDDSSSSHSDGYSGSSGGSSWGAGVSLYDLAPPPPGTPGAHLYLYLAGQSVVDSNSSVTLDMRAWYDDFGLGVRQTSFFEEAQPKWLRLDLWTVSAHYRVLHDRGDELWIEGGLGGLRTIDDLTMIGFQGGLRAEHELRPLLSVTGEARMYLLEYDVRATEARAALKVSILYLSYRVVDFNVGPPLHGPELGIGFGF